eukprot:m.36136 g.36136  ORF g.36136 m.36136 type:complete len:471 (+) comp10991_c0_seq1:62-1474(+)
MGEEDVVSFGFDYDDGDDSGAGSDVMRLRAQVATLQQQLAATRRQLQDAEALTDERRRMSVHNPVPLRGLWALLTLALLILFGGLLFQALESDHEDQSVAAQTDLGFLTSMQSVLDSWNTDGPNGLPEQVGLDCDLVNDPKQPMTFDDRVQRCATLPSMFACTRRGWPHATCKWDQDRCRARDPKETAMLYNQAINNAWHALCHSFGKQLNFSVDTILEGLSAKTALPLKQEENKTWVVEKTWDLTGSMFFATTVITTVGYGTFSPQTDAGKLAVFFYGLVGIIITGASLAVITQEYLKLCEWALRFVKQRLGYGQAGKPSTTQRQRLRDRSYVAALTVLLMLLIGAAINHATSTGGASASFLDSFYYCFVTVATIGFGDFVPNRGEFVLFGFYAIVGIALLSQVFATLNSSLLRVRKSRREQLAVASGSATKLLDSSDHELILNPSYDPGATSANAGYLEVDDTPFPST